MTLDPALLGADQALQQLLERYAFVDFLNPINAPEARGAWERSGGAPPFEYRRPVWADDARAALDRIAIPDHPFAPVLRSAVEETHLLIVALASRTAGAFDALALHAGWHPGPVAVPERRLPAARHDPAISSAEMAATLTSTLRTRGCDWRVRFDGTLASRVLVDAPRRELRVHPHARFRESDRDTLVAHEVDVHVWRSLNGSAQPLALFRTGLPGSLATEEGLAVLAEEAAGAEPGPLHARRALMAAAVHHARNHGFTEVHRWLAERVGPDAAWGVAVRVKRGLAAPDEPGVYAKDAVYWLGHRAVSEWRAAGRPMSHLYVGKVGVSDPVAEWVRSGLVTLGPVPELWLNPPESDCA